MSQFTNSIRQVAKNYGKYDAWEQTQADRKARKEYLAANTDIPQDKFEHVKKRAETVIRATEIMDAKSEDNCEDMEQLTEMIAAVPAVGISMLQTPAIIYVKNKIDKKYTSQIENLRSELSNLTESHLIEEKQNKISELISKKSKAINKSTQFVSIGVMGLALLSAIYMILWGTKKQKEASRIGRYQAKQNELKGVENFVIYTPEQIQKAEEIARSLPDKKDKNNLTKMISELKAMSRDKTAYKAWLRSKDPKELEKLKQVELSPEQLIKAAEDKELIVDTVKEINIKAEEYSENLENAFDTISTLSWLIAIPAGIGINKILKLFKANPGINRVVSVLMPVIVPLYIGMKGTLEQKEAARIGRFHARKDLLKNPARLMAFSDEEMKNAENIKAEPQKKGLFKKIGESFSFLTTYSKDKKQYNNYKKKVKKQNEKLQVALKQIEITDTQKAEAKSLQKNVFRAFDEVDEMSQMYSEDVEAGCEIAKEIGSSIWSIGSAAAILLAGLSIAKGKFPIAKITNKLTNLTFDANSSIKKAINSLYETIKKKDKSVMQDFQKSIVKGDLDRFLQKTENADIAAAFEPLKAELEKLVASGVERSASGPEGQKNFGKIFKELLNSHLKQSAFAKWLRNMLSDCAKLFAKSKMEKQGIELTPELKEQFGLNFNYKNYKTLINTGIVGAVPIFGILWSVPYAFNAWLTNIQKKAGKIGVMQAVENIDDPRIFANKEV